MNTTDVLVVGAGPTGLTLSTALSQQGVDVTVVDRLAAGANTSRAVAIAARTLEVLEGLGVSARLTKEGIHVPRFSIRQRDQILMPIDFSALPTKYPYTLTISQAATEQVLLDRLAEVGTEVLRPTAVTAVSEGEQGPVATFDDGDSVSARYVVGCDGMHSTVRDQARIAYRGHAYSESFALADVHLQGGAPADEIVLFFAGAGLLVLVPLPGGVHRIVAPVSDQSPPLSAEFFQRLLDTRAFGPGRLQVVGDPIWASEFRIHHRVVDSYRAGHVLVVGDAAHVHSPAGGQGMNLGIQDATVLADVLVRVLGGASDDLLDDFGKARRPIAKQVLRLTDRLTRLATLPRIARPARNAAISLASAVPGARRALAWRLSGLVYR